MRVEILPRPVVPRQRKYRARTTIQRHSPACTLCLTEHGSFLQLYPYPHSIILNNMTSDDEGGPDDPLDGRAMPVVDLVRHPKTEEEADTVCAWVGRTVRLHGLQKKPSLNGQWGKTICFDVREQRFQVRLDLSRECILVKPDNVEIITNRMAQTDEKRHQERKAHNAEVYRTRSQPRASPPPERKKSSKLQSRGGAHPHLCSCHNEPMTLCENEAENTMIEAGPGSLKLLASSEIGHFDGQDLSALTSILLQDCYEFGYQAIAGCECESWREQTISENYPEQFAGCCHFGNNPLQPPLPDYYNNGLAAAMLNLAWRDDDETRFAAVELFVALIVTSPPPQYIFSPDFFFAQLQLYMTLCSGHSDTSKAAANAVRQTYDCAVGSRPVDYDVHHFMTVCVQPLRDLAERGSYRAMFEARQGDFFYYPRTINFTQFHNRRYQLKLQCDGCGKFPSSFEEHSSLMGCKACRQVMYCCKTCQKKDWKKRHKATCPKLASIYEKNKKLAWKPELSKQVCRCCGFGPASEEDMSLHGQLTGHNPLFGHTLDNIRMMPSQG